MKIKNLLILLFCLGFFGCKTKNPDIDPPNISTIGVIKKLEDTQSELEKIGLDNSKMGLNIEKALTLAERLKILLDKIEKEQQTYQDKMVLLPEL
jgi:hypothetical protein